MKNLLLLLPFFVFACNSDDMGEPEHTDLPDVAVVDTLPQLVFDSVIVSHELANTPFHAEDNFIYFEEIQNQSDSAILEIVPGMHDESVMDSITTLYWGKSSMSKLKNEFICCDLMQSVFIEDDRLKLRNGIGVGDSAHGVFSSFDLEFDPDKNYSFIQLEAGEATNFLIIVFTNNVVSRIVYWPYTG